MSTKSLGQAMSVAGSSVDLYTVPAGSQAQVELIVCNIGSVTAAFHVRHRIAGASPSDKQYLYHDMKIDPGETLQVTESWSLGSGDVVSIQATSSTISMNLSGEESKDSSIPEVLYVSPEDGDTGVSKSSPISWLLSLPVDEETAISDNVTVMHPAATPVLITGTVSLSEGGHKVVFTPDGNLPTTSEIVAILGAGITSDGVPLASSSTIQFETGS